MPKDDTTEVETEVLAPEDVETEEEEDDNDVVVPALEEKPTEEDVEELKSKPSETIEENKEETEETEPEETDEEPEPQVLKQPKPVEGEPIAVKVLRTQVTELREKLRDKESIIKIAQPIISNEEYEKLKDEYAPEELEKVEKLLNVVGKKLGYVKAEEIYSKDGNDVLEQFIEKHPEYKPENDPEDLRWNTFRKILDKDYNRTGKQPKELTKLFEKVNRDVLEEFGESPKTTIKPGERNASIQKVRSVSHTGGTKTEIPKKSNAPTDPNVRKMFKDFDDEDF